MRVARPLIALAALSLLAAGYAVAQVGGATSADLAAARRASQEAAARAAQLEAAAAREGDAARKAQALAAATAAKVDQAAADIAAGQARIALLDRVIAARHDQLAAKQAPVARLLAALQSMASRPAVIAVAQPGSVDDMVHVRAVLASAMPVMRARTADLRAEVGRTRRLREDARLAAAALDESRRRLETQQLALARAEAAHRGQARVLGRGALAASDRAIALGEQARDLVDGMDRASGDAATAGDLAGLPDPAPRPPRPGDAVAAPLWETAPYRLPVAGKVVRGLGDVSDAGVRARGLTIAAASGAAIVAPASGRIAYAGAFRDYGTIVIIDHGGGWTTLIAGLGSLTVRDGERVAQGSAIGRAGGDAAPRVTVELRRRDRAIDMTPLLG